MDEQLQPETADQVSPVIDLTDLESKLTDLVEVLEADQEQKKAEAEKLAKQEEEAKQLAEEQAKTEAENAQLTEAELKEKAKADEEHAKTVMSLQESQATTLDDILSEMQTLNENVVLLHEKTDFQNEVITESAVMITIAVVMASGVKLFLEQISKW